VNPAETLTAAATIIQRFARGHLARLHYRNAVTAVVTLQAGGRGMLARKKAREMRRQRAALSIQTAWRRHKLREEYKHVYGLVVAVQAQWRGRQARALYAQMRSERAATVLQANWRRHVAASAFERRRAAATVLQNAWRVKAARAALRVFKTEAREAGKLLEDKKALEGKVRGGGAIEPLLFVLLGAPAIFWGRAGFVCAAPMLRRWLVTAAATGFIYRLQPRQPLNPNTLSPRSHNPKP